MAPAQLELFKFSLYVFFPIAAMLHFGDPDWYDTYVGPLRAYYTQADKKQVAPPQTTAELQIELSRLREERLLKKKERVGLPIAEKKSVLELVEESKKV